MVITLCTYTHISIYTQSKKDRDSERLTYIHAGTQHEFAPTHVWRHGCMLDELMKKTYEGHALTKPIERKRVRCNLSLKLIPACPELDTCHLDQISRPCVPGKVTASHLHVSKPCCRLHPLHRCFSPRFFLATAFPPSHHFPSPQLWPTNSAVSSRE